jgi:putative ABC transport system substrate-binding protein
MTTFIGRREFISLLGGATAAWPLAARAQERTPVLGILLLSDAAAPSDLGVVRELSKLGYSEVRNITYAVRGANGEIARLPKLARELLAAEATVIAGLGSPVASALAEATHDIPIVMMIMGDPIALGLSESLSRPSRNVTGFTSSNLSLAAKRLELLRELLPAARKIGYLWARESPIMTARTEQTWMAAKHLDIDLVSLPLASAADVPNIFARVDKEQLTAILVESDALITRFSATIVDECLIRDLPAMHAWPFEVRAGALMAYGPALTENNQGSARYIDRILKGTKVSDLPIQEPTQIKLAINLRTARSIGLEIPPMLLARADEVIE